MSSWLELQTGLEAAPPDKKGAFVQTAAEQSLNEVANLTRRPAIIYASGFLQKPHVPGIFTSVNMEDVNGFMACLHGVDCSRGLTLILHTPGGMVEAAETIVQYLWSKFDYIETIIPTYAMSAGTMIALASNSLVMGRHSQLGPTDPQIMMNGGQFSAHSIMEQFAEAKLEISKDPNLASAWAPVLQPFGPALLQEARKAIAYASGLVESWLAQRMFMGRDGAQGAARLVAEYFGGNGQGSHGRRIDREQARAHGIVVRDLETEDGKLQSAALTLYHALTLIFDNTPAAKVMFSTNGATWVKNVGLQVAPPAAP